MSLFGLQHHLLYSVGCSGVPESGSCFVVGLNGLEQEV
jgi:hypothetical protein